MKILLVEDKKKLAAHLGAALENEGHYVTLAYDGEEGLRLGRTNNFDLLILDVMLPKLDGFSAIKKLREERFATQTIIVSARDTMQDIIYGLDAGADDYLTKPFALDVLLAKVRASERRLPEPTTKDFIFADLVFRPHLYELHRGDRTASLTRTECALLEILMRRCKMVVPHSTLIDEGWGRDAEVSFESLYVLIGALRAKITRPGETELLHTVRGVGYTLRIDPC
jgi:two-component system response regulator MprA